MRILLVEDDEDIAFFVNKSLQAEGFSVDLANNGERGESLAILNNYDVAVMDVNLPKKNGIEICKSIREKGKTYPVIFLTVEGEVKKKVEALNTGGDDYLTKPFSIEELMARIRSNLRRSLPTKQGDQLVYRDVIFDINSHRVTRAGREIKLRKKEYSLLEYFMRNHDRLLTRSMILEHVWDANADPFTNTIDVHVKLLRDKLNAKSKIKLIKTVHGIGYRL